MPLAFATVIYSLPRTSKKVDLVILAKIADIPVPRVKAGNTRWRKLPLPETGNHPSFNEKKIIRRGPSQKFGMETPKRAKNIAPLSIREYCLRAAMIPRGMAISIAISKAAKANSSVAGNLSKIEVNTGLVV